MPLELRFCGLTVQILERTHRQVSIFHSWHSPNTHDTIFSLYLIQERTYIMEDIERSEEDDVLCGSNADNKEL